MPALIASGRAGQAVTTEAKSGSVLQVSVGKWWAMPGACSRKSFGNGPLGEPACGLIIRRSGVRVPTPVLPELARQVPTIQATYGKPTKARHPVPIRPFPALPGVRAARGATRVWVVAPAPEDNPDLAAVVEAWPDLPKALKAGILAMVKAAFLRHPDRGGSGRAVENKPPMGGGRTACYLPANGPLSG